MHTQRASVQESNREIKGQHLQSYRCSRGHPQEHVRGEPACRFAPAAVLLNVPDSARLRSLYALPP